MRRCICVMCVTSGIGKGFLEMNLMLCRDYSGATMESCVWEVFLEHGNPHELACTIIPSVCLFSFTSFSLLPDFCLQLPHISRRYTVFFVVCACSLSG